MGRYSSFQPSLSHAKSDQKKEACLDLIARPPSPSQPFLFCRGYNDKIVPKCLLSFRKKSPAPLITKQSFEMWNEFRATHQCVFKALGTCNNSSWTCELSYRSQRSANSEVKLNRGHMVQWLDRYFGICDVQVSFSAEPHREWEFGQIIWQKV